MENSMEVPKIQKIELAYDPAAPLLGIYLEKDEPTNLNRHLRHRITFFFKVTQLCLPLCDPMDYTILGILQARILE